MTAIADHLKWVLVRLLIPSLALAGCSAIATPTKTPSAPIDSPTTSGEPPASESQSPAPTGGSSTTETGAWQSVRWLVDASSESEAAFHLDFAGLVTSATLSGDLLVLSVDRVEESNSESGGFTNASVDSTRVKMSPLTLILVDPHNGFSPLAPSAFEAQLDAYEGNPFYFYSLDGEVSILVQMMLP